MQSSKSEMNALRVLNVSNNPVAIYKNLPNILTDSIFTGWISVRKSDSYITAGTSQCESCLYGWLLGLKAFLSQKTRGQDGVFWGFL